MTIQLMFNKSEEDYIYKNVENVGTALTGKLRDEMSVMNPEILFEMSVSQFKSNDSSTTPNYLYIQELGRYYFIRDVVSVKNNLTVIKCEEDVLYTYKGYIDLIEGITERSEEKANRYIQDNNYSLNSYPEVQLLQFETNTANSDGSLSDTSTILVLGGLA